MPRARSTASHPRRATTRTTATASTATRAAPTRSARRTSSKSSSTRRGLPGREKREGAWRARAPGERVPAMRTRALLLALALLALAAAPARAAGPSPGAAGLNDRLDPGLGNGGYDALHYDLNLPYATSEPSQAIDGTVTIAARATQALSQFNLDFAGQSVSDVTVDGASARSRRDGEELIVTPKRWLRDGDVFIFRAHFNAVPTEID